MQSPLLCRLPILHPLLDHLCLLTSSLRELGLALKVCLTFAFFAMLRQSNLAPHSAASFDPSRYMCRGNIFLV